MHPVSSPYGACLGDSSSSAGRTRGRGVASSPPPDGSQLTEVQVMESVGVVDGDVSSLKLTAISPLIAGLREFEVTVKPWLHNLGLVRPVGSQREADTEARLSSGRLYVAVGGNIDLQSFAEPPAGDHLMAEAFCQYRFRPMVAASSDDAACLSTEVLPPDNLVPPSGRQHGVIRDMVCHHPVPEVPSDMSGCFVFLIVDLATQSSSWKVSTELGPLLAGCPRRYGLPLPQRC